MIINQAFNNELATVRDHGFSVQGDKKTPCVWFDFVFHDLKGDKDEDVTVKAYLYLSDAAIDYTLDKLANLGWYGNDATELDPREPNAFDFKGRKALLTGEIESYKGKNRPKVNFINDPDAPFKDAPIDPKELKVINAKMKGKIAAYRSKNGFEKPYPIKPEEYTEKIAF